MAKKEGMGLHEFLNGAIQKFLHCYDEIFKGRGHVAPGCPLQYVIDGEHRKLAAFVETKTGSLLLTRPYNLSRTAY